jgi:hypothetical protein
MPRCRKCNQPYTGAFHVNCPGAVPATARLDAPGRGDEVPVTFIAQLDAPTAPPARPTEEPLVQAAPAPARGNSPFGTPQRAAPPARRQLPADAVHPPAPTTPAPAAPPPIAAPASSPRHAGHHCTVIARHQTQQRRPPNDTAIAATLGMVLLLFAFIGYLPCLIMLALLVFVLFRLRIFGPTASLFRLMFPGGQVPAWHFEVFDHDRSASYSVILLDPVGVAPVERSRVLVRGRMRRNYFQATQIMRETDANGVPVLGQDGLIARRMPPTWLAAALLGAGILLNLAIWLR